MSTPDYLSWGEEFTEYEMSRISAARDQEKAEWFDEYIDFLEGKRDAYLDELEEV